MNGLSDIRIGNDLLLKLSNQTQLILSIRSMLLLSQNLLIAICPCELYDSMHQKAVYSIKNTSKGELPHIEAVYGNS